MSDTQLAQPGDTIVIASDHAGVDLKTAVSADLARMGYKLRDLGTASNESVDYPDYGHAVAHAVAAGEAKAGVVICGTGIGISIAANRHAGVRAALVHDDLTARMARAHNDANVIALGARVVPAETARTLVRTFFETSFEGGRHARRVEKLG